MQAGSWVDDHVTSGQLSGMRAVDIVDDQLPPVVFIWFAQKKGCGDIGAYPVGRAGNLHDRIIQMRPKRFTAFVTVEERRKDPERQRRCDEKRVSLQGRDDHVAQFACLRAGVSKLTIVLNDL